MLHDLRYVLRLLAARPGFTALVLLILALGIGANTAIFSVLHAVVLRPLRLPEAHRLVSLWETDLEWPRSNTSFATFQDLKACARSLDRATAFASWHTTLAGKGSNPGEPELVAGLGVQRFGSTLRSQARSTHGC